MHIYLYCTTCMHKNILTQYTYAHVHAPLYNIHTHISMIYFTKHLDFLTQQYRKFSRNYFGHQLIYS